MQFIDRQKAFEAQKKLVEAKYPAAFNNAGWLFIKQEKNFLQAVKLFRVGAQLGDADSMVSLAEMIEQNHTIPLNPGETPGELYRGAAQLGNALAQMKVQADQQNAIRAQEERARQDVQARQMMDFFGTVLRSVPR